MATLKMKNYNLILTEKQGKYRHNHQVKLINMNILQLKKYYVLIKVELQDKLSLLILLYEKLLKNQLKQLKVKVKSK